MAVMTLPLWEDDQALLAELNAALAGAAPVPDEFVAAALGALAWRGIDADLALAELTFDSVWDTELATRARVADSVRTLAFDGGGMSVEIEITAAGITGQLTPAVGGRVSCQTPAGTFDETTADAVGCFVLGAPPTGPVRLHLRHGDRTVATSWICLG
jgi:hypothetical protein